MYTVCVCVCVCVCLYVPTQMHMHYIMCGYDIHYLYTHASYMQIHRIGDPQRRSECAVITGDGSERENGAKSHQEVQRGKR